MTKIYLVKFMRVNEDASVDIYAFEAFTNKKKAIQYQRYWNAHSQQEKKFKGDKFEIEELKINNYDYTKWANEEEMKNLPY